MNPHNKVYKIQQRTAKSMELLQFRQEDCPEDLREQILSLMQQEWPQAFAGQGDAILWPDHPENQPMSLVLVADGRLISHVAVQWKWIDHEGDTYKVYGLSEVMTAPSDRRQGFGLRLVKAAVSLIEQGEADLGVFTCDPPLVGFYAQGGWGNIPNTCLVGGTREKPFRSDAEGKSTMIRFFSEKAEKNRRLFEGADLYLELGERALW